MLKWIYLTVSDDQLTLTDADRSTENRKILQKWRANVIALADAGCWLAGFHMSMEFMDRSTKESRWIFLQFYHDGQFDFPVFQIAASVIKDHSCL